MSEAREIDEVGESFFHCEFISLRSDLSGTDGVEKGDDDIQHERRMGQQSDRPEQEEKCQDFSTPSATEAEGLAEGRSFQRQASGLEEEE